MTQKSNNSKSSPNNLLKMQKEIQELTISVSALLEKLNNIKNELKIELEQSNNQTKTEKPKHQVSHKELCKQAIEYAKVQETRISNSFCGDYHFFLFGNQNILISFVKTRGNNNQIFKHVHQEHKLDQWFKDNEKIQYPNHRIKNLEYKNLYGLLIKCLKNKEMKNISYRISEETTDKYTKQKKPSNAFIIEGDVQIHNKTHRMFFVLASTKSQKQGKAKFLLRSFYAKK